MKQSEKKYKRIVIKVGSSLFYSANNAINFGFFSDIVSQVVALKKIGKEVVIVSSGAIALGLQVLNLKERPKDLAMLQAVAAIGQNALMNRFSSCFEAHNVQSAQILLTWDDFNDRKRYLNAKDTIMTLLKLGSVPIINENDTVSTEEIKFGDNDKLSALVAKLVNADLLIMLSDVDGLLDRDGKTVIRIVDEINAGVKALGYPTTRKTSVGGMITKIEAAKIAIDSGIPCVIAHGHIQGIINSIIHKPCEQGTTFLSKKALCAKDHWIAFGTKVKGQVVVDEGAKKALLNKKSLLSVGITGLAGSFQAGDIVSIMDKEGNSLARGKISISSEVLEKIKGKRYEKEIIHRDNIVIL